MNSAVSEAQAHGYQAPAPLRHTRPLPLPPASQYRVAGAKSKTTGLSHIEPSVSKALCKVA